MDPTFVLASASPRRKELLLAAGYLFQVIVADDSAETSVPLDLPPSDYVAQASCSKAADVALRLSTNEVVIAADTIAVLGDQIIGKPSNRAHAREFLKRLSGTIHQVLTGVTVWSVANGSHVTHVESTTLSMQSLTESQLEGYLESNQWEGKAGAFGYQDGIAWVTIKEGLESNVVGLPVERLPHLIKRVTCD